MIAKNSNHQNGIARKLQSFVEATTEALQSANADPEAIDTVEDTGQQLLEKFADQETDTVDADVIEETTDENDTADDETAETADETASDESSPDEELTQQVEDNTARIDAISNGLSNAHDRIAELRDDTDEIEASLDDETPSGSNRETTLHDTLTPIERLTSDEMDVSDVSSSPYAERAVKLFENLKKWGTKTPKGYVLRPKDNPLALLESACDEDLVWKQYYRTAEMLEKLSKGSITFFDSDRHGKMICLHEQSEMYERVKSGSVPLSSSSAGAKA